MTECLTCSTKIAVSLTVSLIFGGQCRRSSYLATLKFQEINALSEKSQKFKYFSVVKSYEATLSLCSAICSNTDAVCVRDRSRYRSERNLQSLNLFIFYARMIN
ncbi:hypothetical protein CCV52592_0729 [Campylobacter curvus 525.92]|uniref:Uncharacterized protein n=1 Tax=Campylobacter curvus (strain 525.92) TaxID=360105 RepID=A0A0M5MDZ9_CAMC5|nr:hypothetical protein CCV52592_0729 [Campylobacter curvus 525.92]